MNKPIILDGAIARIKDDNKFFIYDYFSDVNVIYSNNNTIPFIETGEINTEVLTKTRVKRESDDENLCLLELLTKTKVQREQDDEPMHSPELQTKTFVEREKDDDADVLLELLTKTEVKRERDDE